MTSAADALYEGITAGRGSRSGELHSSPDRLVRLLLPHYGPSNPPPGLSARSWRRARGTGEWHPRTSTVDALRGALRRARLSPAREAWIRHAHVGVACTLRISKDVRDRRIIVSTWGSWPGDEPSTLITQWLRRDDGTPVDTIVGALEGEIGDAHVLSLTAVRFFRTASEAHAWSRG